jgi:predicted secreted protein
MIRTRIPRTLTLFVAGAAVAVTALAPVASAASAPHSAPTAKKYPTLVVRDLPTQVRLVPGERVRIVQSTNLTTGYSFFADGGCCTADDKAIARVSKGVYKAPESTGMVGVPGTTTWVVTALRPGTTEIQIITRPPGVDNTMQDETVGTLRVIVMPRN